MINDLLENRVDVLAPGLIRPSSQKEVGVSELSGTFEEMEKKWKIQRRLGVSSNAYFNEWKNVKKGKVSHLTGGCYIEASLRI